jgi:hypothetical protein
VSLLQFISSVIMFGIAIIFVLGLIYAPDALPYWQGIALSLLYLALGIAFAYLGTGLYHGKGWAWKYTIIAQGVNIPITILIPIFLPDGGGGGFGSIFLVIIIILYMLKKKTRAYFGRIELEE